MNRDHQTHMGPSDACYYADHRGCPFPTMCECSCHKSKVGDSTPPATPVEPPALPPVGDMDGLKWAESFVAHVKWKPEIAIDEGTMHTWFANAIMAGYDEAMRRASHPPAVSGEGERLKEQAAAYRAIALDALACWQGEDDHSDDRFKRSRSARSRAALRKRMREADRLEFASTPTLGAPR